MKKILIILSWTFFISGIFFLMGFSASKRKEVKCVSVDIQIDFSEGNRFIEKEDIESLIKDRCDSLIGKKITSVETTRLERLINSHPAVKNAEVFEDIDGKVSIEIEQRKPILRIINARNENYYIDEDALLMPLSYRYSALVPVANGYITEGYANYYGKKLMSGYVPDTILHNTILEDLFIVADVISKDEFLNGLVQQIYVNNKMDFEIIPRAGDHIIYMGSANDTKEKFDKLKAFYKRSIKNGLINTYSVINLQYKNQVVCTKKI